MNSNDDWHHATNENDVENQPSADSLMNEASKSVGIVEGNRSSIGFEEVDQALKLTSEGSAEEGSAEEGSAEEGSAEEGSAEEGSAEEGSAEEGSAESLSHILVVTAAPLPNRKKRKTPAEKAQELRETIERLEKEAAIFAAKARVAERKNWDRRYFLLGKAVMAQMASHPPEQARALETMFVDLMAERDQAWYREHPHSAFENKEPEEGETADLEGQSAN